MLSSSELKILKFIKYTPVILVITLSLFITSLFLYNKYTDYKNNLKNIEKKFISESRKKVKDEVLRAYNYILYEKANSEEKLKDELKDRVNTAYKIINDIYYKYKDKETKKEILDRIKDFILAYRFNAGRGYFYINNLEGKNLIHPILPQLEGKELINIKDVKGKYLVQELISNLKKKDEYFSVFYWTKPSDKNNEYKKISFNKIFKPLNLYLGTGEYLVDFERNLQKRVLSYINSFTYDKNGYIFIFDYEGFQIAHIKKTYLGLNRINLKDSNNFFITKESINMAKKGQGYIKYIGTVKPETNKAAEKTTYIKGLQEWGWAIGSGFYTDELEDQIQKTKILLKNKTKIELIELILICLVLSLFALVLSFSISKKLEKHFYRYKNEVSKQIKKNRQKDSLMSQQSKMAAMGEMIANIAHQWRQPLNSISTLATGIKFKQEFGSLSIEEIKSGMDRINESSKYLSQTIEDFRQFFNPEKEKNYFDLKDAVLKTLVLIAPQFISRDILIKEDLKNLEIYAYKNELIQVLINILNNSRDELDKKDLETKLILIKITKDKNTAYISITDNAGGIKDDIINRVFEPYFTTKHKAQGTGIGLYMSREIIIKHMNGSINARNVVFNYENKEYKGACFTIGLSLD